MREGSKFTKLIAIAICPGASSRPGPDNLALQNNDGVIAGTRGRHCQARRLKLQGFRRRRLGNF
jgi:hypothetical protein